MFCFITNLDKYMSFVLFCFLFLVKSFSLCILLLLPFVVNKAYHIQHCIAEFKTPVILPPCVILRLRLGYKELVVHPSVKCEQQLMMFTRTLPLSAASFDWHNRPPTSTSALCVCQKLWFFRVSLKLWLHGAVSYKLYYSFRTSWPEPAYIFSTLRKYIYTIGKGWVFRRDYLRRSLCVPLLYTYFF